MMETCHVAVGNYRLQWKRTNRLNKESSAHIKHTKSQGKFMKINLTFDPMNGL